MYQAGLAAVRGQSLFSWANGQLGGLHPSFGVYTVICWCRYCPCVRDVLLASQGSSSVCSFASPEPRQGLSAVSRSPV